MKHQFKRVMALLLVIAMVLSVMPSVFAAHVEPFKDVQDNAWYAEYVKNVYEAGLMTGVKNDRFNPDGTSTRAQVVTVLYRVKGEPPVGGPATFTDLTADWYANPVAWAQKNNIVNGISATKFGPNNNVTREQLVTMIWRYYGMPKGNGDLTAFSDHGKVSGYAKDAFAWAIGAGVINGSNGKLNPQGLATRAQFAKIIWTAMEANEPCGHEWGEGVVTKEATCVDTGVKTYTCALCGETKTEELPTIDHNFVDGTCAVCGEKEQEETTEPTTETEPPVPGEEYSLTAELKDGDEVIIYNAGNGKGLANVMSGYYVAGVDLTVTDNKIVTEDASVVWTVKVNEDGSYTFVNGETELGADTSVNGEKTYTNLYVEAGHKNKWALEVCNADNSSFFVTNTEIAAKYGKVYLEWYAKNSAFSAYDTSSDRATEQDFGFQFYAKNPVGPCVHAWNEGEVTTAATCAEDGVMTYTCTLCGATKTEAIPATGEHSYVDGICSVCGDKQEVTTYALVSELKDGAEVIIYNAGNSKAVTNVMSGYYVAGADLTAADGKIATNDASVVWTVKANADGTYTFINGETELGADVSGTYTNLFVEAGHKNTWALEVCNAENSSYFVTNPGLTAQYGKIYLEWYAKKTAFSAYDTSAERATEQDFGFQFYAKAEEAHDHTWDEGAVTTEPTCVQEGVKTYTCTECGETKTEAIPATGEHSYVDGICSVCGDKQEATTYALVSELKDGAEVIIYNAGNSKAVTNVMSGYYVAGADLTAADGKIATNDASVVWTVKANADGTYTFINGETELGADVSGTYTNLFVEAGHKNTWALEVCNAENSSYFVTNPGLTAQYGKIYLEWYAKKTAFSAYDTSAERATEQDFGFQFYAKEEIVVEEKEEFTILYTNDVHTYIDNDLTKGGLRYSHVAGLRNAIAAEGKDVILVDAGDHVQGTAHGGLDNGVSIMNIMNAAKYDLATLGNHEFDYGMAAALENVANADFSYVSANFYHEKDGVRGENVLDSFQIFELGNSKVALVGITTPETFTKSTPAYFMDENGNYIYGIAGGTDGAALYADVQKAIDEAKAAGADYIIALGHLGDDPASDPWNSEDVISNVTGLDAFIDGHSHSTVARKEVADKNGNIVVLTQTGEYLKAIGKMTISAEGEITTELITAATEVDEEVKAVEEAWIASVQEQLGVVIAQNEVDFRIKDDEGTRLIRSQETNLGDFCADALYYLFDVTEGLGCDIAVMNGGGIRANMPVGEVSYLTTKTVHTFGNVACLIEVTGQQILDALEWGAKNVGVGENGGFLQVAGATYEINKAIPSTVQADDKAVWIGAPTGAYRVRNVYIGGEPLDVNKTYKMAGYNYTLRDLGDGFAMFDGAVNIKDYVMQDYLVLANYAMNFPNATIQSGNSPLGTDYSDINGEGRITIVDEAEEVPCEHVWNEGETTTAAACETAGVMTYTCTICGETKTEEIPATGHDYVDYICTVCGAEDPNKPGETPEAPFQVATELAVGDKIVITAAYTDDNGATSYYAAANDGDTVKNALYGASVSITDGVLDIGTADVIWEVCAGTADGSFVLKSSTGMYLVHTSKTTVVLKADAGSDWNITCGEGTSSLASLVQEGRFLVFRNNATSGPQFRCYASSNSTGEYSQVITIYKYVG